MCIDNIDVPRYSYLCAGFLLVWSTTHMKTQGLWADKHDPTFNSIDSILP